MNNQLVAERVFNEKIDPDISSKFSEYVLVSVTVDGAKKSMLSRDVDGFVKKLILFLIGKKVSKLVIQNVAAVSVCEMEYFISIPLVPKSQADCLHEEFERKGIPMIVMDRRNHESIPGDRIPIFVRNQWYLFGRLHALYHDAFFTGELRERLGYGMKIACYTLAIGKIQSPKGTYFDIVSV
jgi:hypothetical protein